MSWARTFDIYILKNKGFDGSTFHWQLVLAALTDIPDMDDALQHMDLFKQANDSYRIAGKVSASRKWEIMGAFRSRGILHWIEVRISRAIA